MSAGGCKLTSVQRGGAPRAVLDYLETCRNFTEDYDLASRIKDRVTVPAIQRGAGFLATTASLGISGYEAKKLWGFTGGTVAGLKIPATVGKLGALHSVGVTQTANAALKGPLCFHGKLFGLIGAGTPVGHVAAIGVLAAAGLYAGYEAIRFFRSRSIRKQVEEFQKNGASTYHESTFINQYAELIKTGQCTLTQVLNLYKTQSAHAQPQPQPQPQPQQGMNMTAHQPQARAFSAVSDLYASRSPQPQRTTPAPAKRNPNGLEIDTLISEHSPDELAKAMAQAGRMLKNSPN